MKIRAYITAYNRPKMLASVIDTLHGVGIVPIVYEDGVTHPKRGKEGYWQTWDEMLKDAEQNEADLYLFMPDDFLDIDIDRIKELHHKLNDKPYAYNIINDGRHEQWVQFKRQLPKDGTEQVGFVDCGFFCNREALNATKYKIKPMDAKRWRVYPSLSSGVGMQLTFAFTNNKVKMYKPYKSLAFHGDHKSEMHPNERINNPLRSK